MMDRVGGGASARPPGEAVPSGASTATASLAVAIVSYNVKDLLRECLRATLAGLGLSPWLRSTVWVLDNASSDGSAAMVAEEFPAVRLVASPENLGFARGNNAILRELGFAAAKLPGSAPPDFVLLLNPDAAPLGDALGTMASWLAGCPQAGAVGARLIYPDGRFQHGVFCFPGLLQLWFDLFPPRPRRLLESHLNGRYPRSAFESGRPFPIDFALGAALMARREAIEAIGLLDEGYFMYAEEVDWCWRMQRAGWPLYCVPSAEVIHHGGASTEQFRARSFVDLWRSRKRLYSRFYAPWRRRAAAWIVRLGMRAEAHRARRATGGATESAARLAAIDEVVELFRTTA